jgi:DnaJ-class molecular chaperone
VKRGYEILSDWNKRNIYNQHGEGTVRMVERYRKHNRPENEQRSKDQVIEWQLTLEQLYKGTDVHFTLSK